MPSYIYHSGASDIREARIRHDFDFSAFLVTTVDSESSLKISDVRLLLTQLAISSRAPRLVYFPHAEALTHAGQTALLKVLEEPPSATTFVLSSSQLSLLLPTIRSRCQLVSVDATLTPLNNNALSLVKTALGASFGSRIILADSLGKDRLILLAWFDSLIATLHHKIHLTSSPQQLTFLSKCASYAVSAHSSLKSNVIVSLAVRQFFLFLPRTISPVRMKS